MAVIRSLTVKIGADLTKLQTGLNDAKKHINKFGRDMTAAGQTLTKSITVPIVGMTVALGKMGLDFDDAFDKIRTGTGAAGDALAGLQDNFKNVMNQVPNSMDEVSTAIADLNTRTGLTGSALEDLAVQFLNLSKITGEDLSTTIATSTRLFGDWSVATEDTGATMDYLFKVSQSTGIGITALSDNLVKFGAPLRQMGFDFETSAALMGKFEKEGVNMELVLGGLRIALGKMARAGITDTKAALIEVTQRIKDAGSTGEANAIALDLFGAKIGPDMAAAIREGRFEIDEFMATLAGSTETIGKATEDTRGFAENMQIMKNNLLTALEPLGTKLVEALDTAMPLVASLIDHIAGLIDRFMNLDPEIQKVILSVLAVAAAIGPALIVIGKMATGVGSLIPLIVGLLSPIGLVVAAIAALIAIFVYLFKTNETFRDAVVAVWTKIKEVGVSVFSAVRVIVKLAFEAITAIINVFVGWATAIWTQYADTIKGVTSVLFETIKGVISGALKVIQGALNVFIGIFTGDWGRMRDGVNAIWSGLWDTIKSVISGAWKLLSGAFNSLKESIVGYFTGLAKDALKWGSSIVEGLIDGLRAKLTALKKAAKAVADAIKDRIKSTLKISSPSKVMEEYGRNISQGLQIGIDAVRVDPVISLSKIPDAGAFDKRIPSPTSLTASSLTMGASGGISVNFYAPVYGLLDFEKQVKSIVKDAAINGAFRGVL